MIVQTAEITRGIRITATGTKTAAAQAVIGRVLKVGNSDPGGANVYQAWSGALLVTHNTNTASLNLLTGVATAAAGSPNIDDFPGTDWEGLPIQAASGVRAIVIEDESGSVARTLKIDAGGEVIKLNKGGALVLDAGEGNLLDSSWHTLVFSTVDALSQSWVRISVLSVIAD